MSRRTRRRRRRSDDQEQINNRLMPAPDYANPRESDRTPAAQKGASSTADMLLGLQHSRGNQYVRQLVEDMQQRKSATQATTSPLQQALTPTIQRMAPSNRNDMANISQKLAPENAAIFKEWAAQYQQWFVSQIIEMITERFEDYMDEREKLAKAQSQSQSEAKPEQNERDADALKIAEKFQEDKDNSIFAMMYRMNLGLDIAPEFEKMDRWRVPDKTKTVEDLFGEEVADFVTKENSRYKEAQSTDPHAEYQTIRTAQDLVNVLIENQGKWIPTIADPGSPPSQ